MGIYSYIEQGNKDAVEKILEANPYEKEKNSQDYCDLLSYAVCCNQKEIVALILSKLTTKEAKKEVINKPYIYTENEKKYTVIYDAIYSSNIKILKMLIKAGADVNYKNTNDTTPLHHAAQLGDIEKVKLLIKNGAMVNAQNKDGKTPLHMAVIAANKAQIEGDKFKKLIIYLINQGADISLLDKEHITPFEIANDQVKNIFPDEFILNGKNLVAFIKILQCIQVLVNCNGLNEKDLDDSVKRQFVLNKNMINSVGEYGTSLQDQHIKLTCQEFCKLFKSLPKVSSLYYGKLHSIYDAISKINNFKLAQGAKKPKDLFINRTNVDSHDKELTS
ncbi:ankyrin repeat domain-containing protein [Thiotrichales bacterium 19S9-12]|nr:ankyrin repeat domain-containing protein [Thiotrichales bacterium 19S9-11]MCF6811815.1 ankyrin repeat domain-containing protein [Thiotrichales bacterium 19S9-12]